VAGVLLTREIVPHHTDKSANGLVSGIGTNRGGGVVPARVTTTVHTDTTTARRYRRAPANHANLWLEGTHGMYDPAP
jgi:hypothetical protein